jgi:hypothetical protein
MHRSLSRVALAAVALLVVCLPVPPRAGAADAAAGSILVSAVGDREPATGSPLSLGGAPFTAYSDAALTDVVGTCTTDEAGMCTITGLVDGTYWVAPSGDPAGGAFHAIDRLTTAFGADARYAEPVSVGEGEPTTRRFAFVRENPPFPSRCGVRVTLLFDLSGSISPSELTTIKTASHDFVDALAGTPSSIAVTSFATAAPAAGNTNLAPVSVETTTGVNTVKAAIASLTETSGDDRYTNWDAAFRSVTPTDIVVLFTDGNPTVHGVPAVFPPVVTELDQLEGGVLSANMVKSAGIRVLAVGVGDVADIAPVNVRAVSGPVENSDYAITTFADVDRVFRDLADALCPTPQPPEPPIVTEPEIVVVPVPPRFTG